MLAALTLKDIWLDLKLPKRSSTQETRHSCLSPPPQSAPEGQQTLQRGRDVGHGDARRRSPKLSLLTHKEDSIQSWLGFNPILTIAVKINFNGTWAF